MNEQSNDFGIGYAVGRDTNCGYGGGYGNGMFGGDWAWQFLPLYRATYIEKLRY